MSDNLAISFKYLALRANNGAQLNLMFFSDQIEFIAENDFIFKTTD